jgi:hypothetical protein
MTAPVVYDAHYACLTRDEWAGPWREFRESYGEHVPPPGFLVLALWSTPADPAVEDRGVLVVAHVEQSADLQAAARRLGVQLVAVMDYKLGAENWRASGDVVMYTEDSERG